VTQKSATSQASRFAGTSKFATLLVVGGVPGAVAGYVVGGTTKSAAIGAAIGTALLLAYGMYIARTWTA